MKIDITKKSVLKYLAKEIADRIEFPPILVDHHTKSSDMKVRIHADEDISPYWANCDWPRLSVGFGANPTSGYITEMQSEIPLSQQEQTQIPLKQSGIKYSILTDSEIEKRVVEYMRAHYDIISDEIDIDFDGLIDEIFHDIGAVKDTRIRAPAYQALQSYFSDAGFYQIREIWKRRGSFNSIKTV